VGISRGWSEALEPEDAGGGVRSSRSSSEIGELVVGESNSAWDSPVIVRSGLLGCSVSPVGLTSSGELIPMWSLAMFVVGPVVSRLELLSGCGSLGPWCAPVELVRNAWSGGDGCARRGEPIPRWSLGGLAPPATERPATAAAAVEWGRRKGSTGGDAASSW
jgi:hypothetical protein